MPRMRAFGPGLLCAMLAAGCSDLAMGCSVERRAEAPVADAAAAAGLPHGDHSPHHGGVVMMKADVHFEAVLEPSGSYRLYFSDATRADLPASMAERASITVIRAGEPPEGVPLRIDESGESWMGQGKPVKDPSQTTARIAYTWRGEEPYWIDVPFDIRPTRTEAHR